MKKHLSILSLAVAGFCALPLQVRAVDEVPPTPPGGAAAPPAAPAPGDKPAAPAPGAHRPGGPGGPGGRMDPAARLKKMTEDLGLSQEQQDKIKAIYEKNAPQLKEIMAKGRENLTEEDKTKVRELMKSQQEEVAAILTPEQKEKFKAEMEKRRADREKAAK